jgi:hypothetical protein
VIVRVGCLTPSDEGDIAISQQQGSKSRQTHDEGQITKWVRTPRFVVYANDQEMFRTKTLASMEDAWCFSLPEPLRLGRDPWSPEEAWEALWAHQPRFRLVLDHMSAGQLREADAHLLGHHVAHLHYSESRVSAYPTDLGYGPGWDHCECGAAIDWDGDEVEIYEHLAQCPSGDRLHPYPTPKDPLDMLYGELHRFRLLGGEPRLQRCQSCPRCFVAVTSRLQKYCGSLRCRNQGNVSRREKNAPYQRHRRETRRDERAQDLLTKIASAKAAMRAKGDEFTLDLVCVEANITPRQFAQAQTFEKQKGGRPLITDLTS